MNPSNAAPADTAASLTDPTPDRSSTARRTGRPANPSLGPVAGAVLVFLTSGAVLVLEIVAMRLVAPYVGSTLQTSSAVIGIALAAMALGAWAGGWLADRVDPVRLLGPLLIVSGLLGMVTVPVVRQVGSWLQGRGQVSVVLVLALIAVFPPAAVLSAVAPMIVKLQLADLGRTGAVVGRLSGIGTLGAITATFLTGFVLLANLRASVIVLGTGGVLILSGAWLLRIRPDRNTTVAAALAVPLLPWLFVASPNPCQLETEYHCARIEESPAGTSGRQLVLDTLLHSHVDLSDPRVLEYEYLRTMAAALDAVRGPSRAINGLYIGGGGLTFPRYQAATRPGSSATVMEIDRGVSDIARRFFAADDIPRLTTLVGDGRTSVQAQPDDHFDLVVGDAFGGVAVPWHLATTEATGDVRRVLRPDGVYLANVIDRQPTAFLKAEIATVRAVFPYVAVATPAQTLKGGEGLGGNHVIIAAETPLPVAAIAERLEQQNPSWTVLDVEQTARFAGGARPLTDDFAPVDQLLTPNVAQ